jgi:hypothetical protein
MRTRIWMLAPVLLAAAACSQAEQNQVGESLGNAGDSIVNVADDAGEAIGNGADQAGDAIGNFADDVGERADRVGNSIENETR